MLVIKKLGYLFLNVMIGVHDDYTCVKSHASTVNYCIIAWAATCLMMKIVFTIVLLQTKHQRTIL